jgi:hypothetical protein
VAWTPVDGRLHAPRSSARTGLLRPNDHKPAQYLPSIPPNRYQQYFPHPPAVLPQPPPTPQPPQINTLPEVQNNSDFPPRPLHAFNNVVLQHRTKTRCGSSTVHFRFDSSHVTTTASPVLRLDHRPDDRGTESSIPTQAMGPTQQHIQRVCRGRDSPVGVATRYGLDGPGIESRWGEIFRTRPDRPWGPPSLLYNGNRVCFSGIMRPGSGVDHLI